jgi:hypothetical protein
MALVSRSEFAIIGLWEGCHVNYVDLLLKAVAREIWLRSESVAGRSQSRFEPTSVGQFAQSLDFLQKAGTGSSAPVQCGPTGFLRSLWLRGLNGRSCVSSGFGVRGMAITRGGQVFLKLQPFVERHGGLFALWRRVENTCFRRRRLGPRIHRR